MPASLGLMRQGTTTLHAFGGATATLASAEAGGIIFAWRLYGYKLRSREGPLIALHAGWLCQLVHATG